jgi:Rrf2 family transcriptional regulator, iron-sulfur cluster assembly transcription factor
MIDLADHGEPNQPVRLKEVAARQGISKRYLETVAAPLKKARLLIAVSGRGGGYRLVRSPEEISVGQIIRAIMGEFNIVECVQTPDICPKSPVCPTRKVWVTLHDKILEVLGGFSLADLSEMDLDADLLCHSNWTFAGQTCHSEVQ